jgi:hypothetical protein
MDRRKNERHQVGGTVWFQWKDSMGTGRNEVGTLRNVCAVGIFVETRFSPPPVGTTLNIRFAFDAEKPTILIKTKGHITRIEADQLVSQRFVFAASTSRMILKKASQTPSFTHQPGGKDFSQGSN